jgi:hypothetical protein
MVDCYNLAISGDGRFAVVVGSSSEFVVIEITKNESNPD